MDEEIEDLEITISATDREIVLPGVKTIRFGHLPAPRTVPDLWQLIAMATEGGKQIEGWRGQADLSWTIDPRPSAASGSRARFHRISCAGTTEQELMTVRLTLTVLQCSSISFNSTKAIY